MSDLNEILSMLRQIKDIWEPYQGYESFSKFIKICENVNDIATQVNALNSLNSIAKRFLKESGIKYNFDIERLVFLAENTFKDDIFKLDLEINTKGFTEGGTLSKFIDTIRAMIPASNKIIESADICSEYVILNSNNKVPKILGKGIFNKLNRRESIKLLNYFDNRTLIDLYKYIDDSDEMYDQDERILDIIEDKLGNINMNTKRRKNDGIKILHKMLSNNKLTNIEKKKFIYHLM